ncbi:hypothetical protein [Methanobrevibacter thaueri]|uniref:hypothetical protein n=1 Tax=Methanobrevibacter thaueri TaxID=190975 RepID=UPI00386670D0
MKFRNSILLIVIAIFLLISIGSVCASENLTDDSDAQLADDGTSVVLSNGTDDNVPDETEQEKTNTTVVTDKDKYEFKQDSEKSFSVEVKDNKSSNIDVNKNNLSVMNGNKSISFEYTPQIITITESMPIGNYNLTVNYLGNENYINSTNVIAVKIYGNNTIETETSVVCDGKTIVVPVKVTDQVDYIELNKSNFNLTLVYTNETGNISNLTIREFDIVNDTIKFNTDVTLIAASLIIDYTNATEPKTVNIKVSTEVKAETDKDKFTSEENKSISIKIFAQENQLNIIKSDLKVFDNGKEITNFKYNNSNITLELDIGVHELTILYKGNATYATSNKTIALKVSGNQTISPQETASLDKDNMVNITLNLSDGADPVNVDLDNLTVVLFYKVGDTTYNRTVDVITLADDNQTIRFKVDENFESAYADIKYIAENNLTGTTTIKVGTEITASDLQKGAGEVVNFTVEVKSVNGTAIEITKTNTKIFNNGKEVGFACNNSVITLNNKFAYGIYNLTISYLGTDTYAASTKTIALTVYGINATTSTNINSTKKGEIDFDIIVGNETLNITKADIDNITVSYKNGNDTVYINVTEYDLNNGTLTFTLENGNFTTATLTIKYNETEANVKLNRIYNVEIIPINLVNEYKDGNFTFKLVDVDDNNNPLANKSITLYTTGNIRAGFSATTNDEGIASFKTDNLYIFDSTSTSFAMKQLEVGNYTVEMSVSGALKATKLTTNITVKKANIKIEIAPYKEYYGSDKNITITVTNANSGLAVPGIILRLDMPQTSGKTYYLQTNSDGVGRISAKGLIGGDYDLTVSNNDTKNMNNASTKTTVTVMKIPVKIAASGLTVYYNTGATATIKVTKDGKPVSGMYLLVRLYTTSTKYNDYLFQTNDKGQVSFSASLTVGKHKMIINSADNRYEASQVTKTITVKKASAKITAKKVTDYYKGVKYFTVKLTNTKNNKPIYDAKLNIKVFVSKNRYYNYNGHTGANGEIRLSLETLKPGTYKVVVAGADSKDFTAKEVTSKIVIKKAPAKLTPKKLTAKKGAKKYFKVTVKNKKTKKVIKGVKVKIKVYTGKKAKTFTAKTNAKGIAKILTNKLKVGKHKVVVASADKYVTAKKAKSTIKITK